jgi:hypothetical protein
VQKAAAHALKNIASKSSHSKHSITIT